MKSVYRYHGLGEALLHDGMHTVREVHGDLFYGVTLLFRQLHQHGYHIFNPGSLYDGYDGTFLPVCGLVGENGVQLPIDTEVSSMLRRGPMFSGKMSHSAA